MTPLRVAEEMAMVEVDVLATLATRLRQAGEPVLVVSGDRDLLQLASEGVDILFVGARGKPPTRYDEAAVRARFGIPIEPEPQIVGARW